MSNLTTYDEKRIMYVLGIVEVDDVSVFLQLLFAQRLDKQTGIELKLDYTCSLPTTLHKNAYNKSADIYNNSAGR